jgi:hypothetical protein
MTDKAGSTAHLTEDEIMDLLQSDSGRAAEDDELLQHLRRCDLCERTFAERAGRMERLRAGPIPRWEPGRGFVLDASPPPRERARAPSVARRIVAWVPIAAAAAVLAMIVVPSLRGPRDSTPSRPYWMPVDGDLLALRSSGDPNLDDLGSALDAYRAGDAANAARLLEAVTVETELDELRRIYLASALVLSGQPARAAEVLAGIDLDTVPMPWRDRAWFTLHKAYAALGRRDEARAIAGRLRDSPEVGDRVRAEISAGEQE